MYAISITLCIIAVFMNAICDAFSGAFRTSPSLPCSSSWFDNRNWPISTSATLIASSRLSSAPNTKGSAPFSALSATGPENLEEPCEDESNFGRMAYWDESYRTPAAGTTTSTSEESTQTFSWYCGWTDELGPFFEELVPAKDSFVLIPGIGNDVAIRDMFDAGGYHKLMAFDYAPQGVECAKAMFGEDRLRIIAREILGDRQVEEEIEQTDVFRVCDARDLSSEYDDDTFDAVLDKGTFDSIYLSGGKDKEKAKTNLSLAVSEMKRVLKENGVVFSVTAACVDAVRKAFSDDDDWEQLRDGSLHITEDGYTSNNVDATMLAWKLKAPRAATDR